VALFEGTDEFGRLQPLLGTAEPEVDVSGNSVTGAIAWHSPTTENPGLGTTEIWEIYNATGDAHPVHLHLVNFEIRRRRSYTADMIEQPVLQHNGTTGVGFRLENIQTGNVIQPGSAYVENAPKDMVTALPGQMTEIKMTFDKPGRYVWHCHILSHEDHEMMRVLHVGPGAE
jgi:FtsP/CotA-like multicopper oxidase with cupredoxin domain